LLHNLLENELEISGNSGEETDDHMDDSSQQDAEDGDEDSEDDDADDPQNWEDDDEKDLIINEDSEEYANGAPGAGSQRIDGLSAYLRRTNILQRNYHEAEPNIYRLRLDIYMTPNIFYGGNSLEETLIKRCRSSSFSRFWERSFDATLAYVYPMNGQDIIAHAQQLLSNCISYLPVMNASVK